MFVNVHLQREYNPKQSFFFFIVKLLTPIVNSNNLFY